MSTITEKENKLQRATDRVKSPPVPEPDPLEARDRHPGSHAIASVEAVPGEVRVYEERGSTLQAQDPVDTRHLEKVLALTY